jgi:organic hydroperoxide reductase OsmC/OhrA
MKINRTGSAVWSGGIKDGKGAISTESGALADWAINAVHLTLRAKVPGADQATFEALAAKAKAGCPVSKVLNAAITLDATLIA